MKAGVPKEDPAYTVNRLCGTGVQAIVSACQSIQTGEAAVALAGGAESMSRGPYWMPSARWGARMGEAEMIDPVMGGLTDPFHSILMGVTAENLAEQERHLPRRQDTFAIESHRRAGAARAEGRFDDEIVPSRSRSSATPSSSSATSTSARTPRPSDGEAGAVFKPEAR